MACSVCYIGNLYFSNPIVSTDHKFYYNDNSKSNSEARIFDAIGNLVATRNFSHEKNKLVIHNLDLADGVFVLNIASNSTTFIVNK